MSESGKIVKNGLFYRLENENRTEFIKNYLYPLVLPNDTIRFTRTNRGVLINEIIHREPTRTLCYQLNGTIRLPLLSSHYLSPAPPHFPIPSIGRISIYRVLVTKEDIVIEKDLGFLEDRQKDLERIQDLYTSTTNPSFYEKLQKNSILKDSYYTKKERIDLTNLDTFTIDPTYSKDFDDAISVDFGSNTVYVHIVDINHLLDKYKEFEKDAMTLGYTLYTPEGNLNILPNELAEDHFSLIKNVDRCTITVQMKLVNNTIQSYDIYPSTIRVKKRFDYENAKQALENGDKQLEYLVECMKGNGFNYSKLDIPNRKIIVENNTIRDIVLDYHTVINKVIETFMVAANQLVTKHLDHTIIPHRYHPKSDVENPDQVLDMYDSIDLVKKYKIANYSTKNRGHFGLQLDYYTHFTSPIRRAPDVIVHRILAGYEFNEEDLHGCMEYLNEREKLNELLVDFYERWKLFELFKREKKIYTAKIMSVTRFGISILLIDNLYDDFIHISNIDKNIRWTFREDHLVDSVNPNKIMRKNDLIQIEIIDVDWFNMKVKEYRFL